MITLDLRYMNTERNISLHCKKMYHASANVRSMFPKHFRSSDNKEQIVSVQVWLTRTTPISPPGKTSNKVQTKKHNNFPVKSEKNLQLGFLAFGAPRS